MIETMSDTLPLTALRDNPTELLHQLRSSRRPVALTVDGQPAFIIQEASAYQCLLDTAAQAEEDDAIREGLEDMRVGRTRPLDEVFDEMRACYAIPR